MKVTQSCPTLCNPMDYRVLQARILEWVAVPFSRGSSQPRDWTQVSLTAGGFFTSWTTREALSLSSLLIFFPREVRGQSPLASPLLVQSMNTISWKACPPFGVIWSKDTSFYPLSLMDSMSPGHFPLLICVTGGLSIPSPIIILWNFNVCVTTNSILLFHNFWTLLSQVSIY